MNNRKTPRIRFKGFTDDWEQRKLGEISPLRGGFAFKSEEYADEGIPIIRISNILSDGTVGSEFAYCKEQTDDVAFTLKNGAALLAMSGATTGKVSVLHARNTDKYYQNQRVGYFTQIRDYDYGFVSTIVRSQMFLDQLSAVLVAGAQPNVSSKDIDGFEFMIPMSKVEQEKLGEIFFSLDHLITLHQRKLEKLKIVKKAMLENCFPKNGEKVPKFRFFGFTGDWEQRKLGELAVFNPKEELPDVFEYVDLESVVGTEMLFHRTEEKSTAPSRAQRLANNGDLFYQTVRPYQKNNYLFEKLDKHYVFSTGYAQLRSFVDGYFLLSLVQNGQFVKTVLDNCTGTSYPAINANDLAEIEVFFPKDECEHHQIGTYFRSLDHLITLHQRKLEKLKIIKKSFLEKMFV